MAEVAAPDTTPCQHCSSVPSLETGQVHKKPWTVSFLHSLQWNICHARSSFVAQPELYVGKNPSAGDVNRRLRQRKSCLRQHFTAIHLRSRLASRLFLVITHWLTWFLKHTDLLCVSFVFSIYSRLFCVWIILWMVTQFQTELTFYGWLIER